MASKVLYEKKIEGFTIQTIKKGGDNMKRFIRFLKEEDGLESVEYALLAVLIALGIIVGVTNLSGWINNTFNDVAATTSSGTGGTP